MADTGEKAFVGWALGGMGIVLLASAITNHNPFSVIVGVLTGSDERTKIDPTVSTASTGTMPTTTTGENSELWTDSALPRSQALMNGTTIPVLIPIPTQPTMRLDVSAVPAFLAAQAEWGKPIKLTGATRSTEEQAAGYADDPDRFAPPGKSAHEKGIAIDVNTNTTNVNDAEFIRVMNKHGWVAAGRSGPMHYSYGVRA